MMRLVVAFLATGLLCIALSTGVGLSDFRPQRAEALERWNDQAKGTSSLEAQNVVIGRFCVRCHNDDDLRGGLTLESFDVARADQSAEVAEKMIRKLQAGMMPPPPARRPDAETVDDLISSLSSRLDAAAAELPNPGGRTFQRLNRAEYERAIEELLGIEVDARAFLPPDTISAGFDNIADVQGLTTSVMQGYLRAAGEVSRMALGDPDATPSEKIYTVSRFASQRERVGGAPFGTRGGISIVHIFPADGEYDFRLAFNDSPIAELFGKVTVHDEQIEISIDGERAALLDIDRWMDADNGRLRSEPVFIKAGPRRVSAAFIRRAEGPAEDLLSPHEWSLADKKIGSSYGLTNLPHLRDLSIGGPYRVTGVSATPSREHIFTCRPTSPSEEQDCARQIYAQLASEAYRRPLRATDLDELGLLYQAGAQESGFEGGIAMTLQAILASPHFVFRFEEAAVGAGADAMYRVSDLALATRLSFFLWASAPDEPLVGLAREGRLADPQELQKQVRRMLADRRSEALATRFGAQWLRLQDLDTIHPDAVFFPNFYQQLADAMRRETELLLNYIIRENRSVLELLSADYTFVNERLARHYGIPNITGDHFRRVQLPGEARRGLLGHGSMLTSTSHANRTSPVLRGKWVMEVLLGSPPPPPPPGIPELEETPASEGGRLLTLRERMLQHRADPACSSCHRVIDPIGLALENFDVTGAWRIKDNGVPIEASGRLYDGTTLNGPADLRGALLERKDVFMTTFTENLMAYALGRRIEHYDMPAIRAIVREAAQNEYSMFDFLIGVVTSAPFQKNSRLQLAGVAAQSTETQ